MISLTHLTRYILSINKCDELDDYAIINTINTNRIGFAVKKDDINWIYFIKNNIIYDIIKDLTAINVCSIYNKYEIEETFYRRNYQKIIHDSNGSFTTIDVKFNKQYSIETSNERENNYKKYRYKIDNGKYYIDLISIKYRFYHFITPSSTFIYNKKKYVHEKQISRIDLKYDNQQLINITISFDFNTVKKFEKVLSDKLKC